jgi:hypothetical protein
MKAMTRGRKCRTHEAGTAEEADVAECAWAFPEWEEVHTEVGGAEAEAKATKTGSGCRNS